MSTLLSSIQRRGICGAIGVAALVSGGHVNAQTVRNMSSRSVSTTGELTASVNEAARRFGIPAGWITSVMRVESAGSTRAVSPKGAMGLMQIMPQTWSVLRARYNLGTDPFNPRDNILAGAGYLRELFDRYGRPGFLAAYNAGPGRWEDHLTTARTLPNETIDYVAKLGPMVGGSIDGMQTESVSSAHFAPTIASIFVARSNSPSISNAFPNAGLWQISHVKIVVGSVTQTQPNALFIALTPKGSAQ